VEIAFRKVNSAASFRDEWMVMAQFRRGSSNLQAGAGGNPNHRDGRVVQLRAELVESGRHLPANRCQAINIARRQSRASEARWLRAAQVIVADFTRLACCNKKGGQPKLPAFAPAIRAGPLLVFYLPEVDAAAAVCPEEMVINNRQAPRSAAIRLRDAYVAADLVRDLIDHHLRQTSAAGIDFRQVKHKERPGSNGPGAKAGSFGCPPFFVGSKASA